MMSLRLGAFELGERISQGGMGVVYRGTHVSTGLSVAVKILAADRARDPLFLESFRHEVRAVAALDHPRIVTVYDFGFVPKDRARGGSDISPGAPWIAMEYAEMGSLGSLPQLDKWRDVQAVLFDVLDALAHAHARDLVHRDLKPGNVLLVPESGLVRCKISDFGIAHARGGAAGTHEVFASAAGTPLFMAPEQVESQWRNYGPWTDLYALGALAYYLVSGKAPFHGDSAVEIARRQLYERPSPLEPKLAIPDGLEAWIFQLLAKEFGHRFQRSADALWALRQISPENPSGMRVPVSKPPSLVSQGADTIPSPAPPADEADTGLTTLTFDRGFDFEAFPSLEELSSPSSAAVSMPPIPDDWHHRRRNSGAVLSGAGLGLFGLREVPFVNREDECDLIWTALRHVAKRRVAQGIVLQGPGGIGKARLAEWMARRAHEVGAAKVLVARHGPMSGGFDGIRRMLDHYTNCIGLDLERTYERLRFQLMADAIDPPELVRYRAAALARFLRPEAASARVPPVRIAGPEELFSVLKGVLIRYSRNRPVIVVLRDVQWALGAVELASRVLADQDNSPAPLLLIVTVRDDLAEDAHLANEALDQFCKRGNVIRRKLSPLSDADVSNLLEGIVHLDPQLKDSLVRSARGNPLFCLQIIGNWIEEGRLESTPDGFRIDGEASIPSSAYELWLARLRNAAESHGGSSTLRALEVAAAIGMEVDSRLWREAIDHLDYDVPSGLVDLLIERGLARRSSMTWEFSHSLLREALVDQARRGGRNAMHNMALAEALRGRGNVDDLSRRAWHLARTDSPRAALAAMIDVAERLVAESMIAHTERYLNETERLFAVAGLPSDAIERGRFLAVSGWVYEARGDLEAAYACFLELCDIARSHGWTSLEVESLRGQYVVHQNRTEVAEAIEKLERAFELARSNGLDEELIKVARSLGWMYQRKGEPERAEQFISESIGIADRMGGDHLRQGAVSRAALAEVLRSMGKVERARSLVTGAVNQMREFGDRVGMGDTLNVLAELERKDGNLHEAETAYRESIENYDLAGHISGDLVRANLAMLYLDRNRPFDARELLERAAASFEGFKMFYYLTFTRFGLAQTFSAIGDEDEWDATLQTFDHLEKVYFEREFVEIALRCAENWLSRGDQLRGRQGVELAKKAVSRSKNPLPELDRAIERMEDRIGQ